MKITNTTKRMFEAQIARREAIPMLVGIMACTGAGKTYSALRLGTGVVQAVGGKLVLIDTENRRGLHYADMFDYTYIPFPPPWTSLDYVNVIDYAVGLGAGCIIVDSTSHEHDGTGGLLDFHEAELTRLAGDDWKKREACQMLAWVKPKADHAKFRLAISRSGCHMIFCFRAKESSKPVKGRDGKTTIEHQGFTPIAGDDISFEMTVNMLLLPQANGLPTWRSDEMGEKKHMKLPTQFRGILDDGQPLCEEHGRKLALWARGETENADLTAIGSMKAAHGTEVLRAWWESLPVSPAKKAAAVNMPAWKETAAQVDAQQQVEDSSAADSIDPDTGLREVEISHLSTGIITHPPRSNPTPEDMREIMSPEPIERKEAPAAAPPPQQQTIGEERL